jgi:hypothetical protein
MTVGMTKHSDLRLETLPAPQRRLWDELGACGPEFVLYGGTAIALRLGHRQSMDFDFFSSRPFVPSELKRSVEFLRGAPEQQAAPNTLVCLVDRNGAVQVSFFGGLDLNRVENPETAPNGLRIASLLDLAATKVKTILDRASAKDYMDLSALLAAGISLPQALGAARAVYGADYNPLLSLKALTFFDEGDLNNLSIQVRQQLEREVAAVKPTEIPVLKARAGISPEASQ